MAKLCVFSKEQSTLELELFLKEHLEIDHVFQGDKREIEMMLRLQHGNNVAVKPVI